MERRIADFRRDEEGHWVAVLDCGHTRHVRHDPPFVRREWVLDPAERAQRVGWPLECVDCDRAG